MATKLHLLVIAFIILAVQSQARIEYRKTFIERQLANIETPSAMPKVAKDQVVAGYQVSLVKPIELPGKNPWEQASQVNRPRPHSSSKASTVFLILGPILLLAGLIIFLVGDAHASNDDFNGVFNAIFVKAAGIVLMAGGAVFTIIGGAMKLGDSPGAGDQTDR